jgi:hypothetical protein
MSDRGHARRANFVSTLPLPVAPSDRDSFDLQSPTRPPFMTSIFTAGKQVWLKEIQSVQDAANTVIAWPCRAISGCVTSYDPAASSQEDV